MQKMAEVTHHLPHKLPYMTPDTNMIPDVQALQRCLKHMSISRSDLVHPDPAGTGEPVNPVKVKGVLFC